MTDEDYKYLLGVLHNRYKIPLEDAKDVLQDVLLQLLERPKDIKDVNAYIIRACYRSYYSNKSKYLPKEILCDTLPEIEPEYEEVVDIDKVIDFIDKSDSCCWWEKELVKRKNLEDKTFKELSDECNLPHWGVEYSYFKTIKKLQKEWQEKKEQIEK